jgi:hypothetical protein
MSEITEIQDPKIRQESIQQCIKYLKEKAPYKIKSYNNWTLTQLRQEIDRVNLMLKDPSVSRTAPNWNLMAKCKATSSEKIARFILMKEELIKAKYGTRRQVNNWREDEVLLTYRNYLKHREKSPERFPSPIKETLVIAPKPSRRSLKPFKYNPQERFYYNPRLYAEYTRNLEEKTGFVTWMEQCTDTEKVLISEAMPQQTHIFRSIEDIEEGRYTIALEDD